MAHSHGRYRLGDDYDTFVAYFRTLDDTAKNQLLDEKIDDLFNKATYGSRNDEITPDFLLEAAFCVNQLVSRIKKRIIEPQGSYFAKVKRIDDYLREFLGKVQFGEYQTTFENSLNAVESFDLRPRARGSSNGGKLNPDPVENIYAQVRYFLTVNKKDSDVIRAVKLNILSAFRSRKKNPIQYTPEQIALNRKVARDSGLLVEYAETFKNYVGHVIDSLRRQIELICKASETDSKLFSQTVDTLCKILNSEDKDKISSSVLDSFQSLNGFNFQRSSCDLIAGFFNRTHRLERDTLWGLQQVAELIGDSTVRSLSLSAFLLFSRRTREPIDRNRFLQVMKGIDHSELQELPNELKNLVIEGANPREFGLSPSSKVTFGDLIRLAVAEKSRSSSRMEAAR